MYGQRQTMNAKMKSLEPLPKYPETNMLRLGMGYRHKNQVQYRMLVSGSLNLYPFVPKYISAKSMELNAALMVIANVRRTLLGEYP